MMMLSKQTYDECAAVQRIIAERDRYKAALESIVDDEVDDFVPGDLVGRNSPWFCPLCGELEERKHENFCPVFIARKALGGDK